jgi:hypothetical protein
MSRVPNSVIGTIDIDPVLDDATTQGRCDDSTLGLLLDSFAHRERLGESLDGLNSIRLVASTRLNRWLAAGDDRFPRFAG